MKETKEIKIGFIGLGIMGKPMAVNLLKAGYQLMVNDINQEAVLELTAQGAKPAQSYAEITCGSDVIIMMLPESRHVEDVVFSSGGILENIKPKHLLIDMSSIAPDSSKKIHKALLEKQADALDAPVSGGYQAAEAGTLSIMVGGNESAFQHGLPIFGVLGKKILHMGEAGSGQTTKLCNQMLIGIHIQAVAEAFALAQKSGLNLVKVREALMGGAANSRVLELHGQKILERTFDKPAFKLKLHRKDLHSALEAAKNMAVPVNLTALVAQQMDAAMAQGYAELDHTTIVLIEELLANIKT